MITKKIFIVKISVDVYWNLLFVYENCLLRLCVRYSHLKYEWCFWAIMLIQIILYFNIKRNNKKHAQAYYRQTCKQQKLFWKRIFPKIKSFWFFIFIFHKLYCIYINIYEALIFWNILRKRHFFQIYVPCVYNTRHYDLLYKG